MKYNLSAFSLTRTTDVVRSDGQVSGSFRSFLYSLRAQSSRLKATSQRGFTLVETLAAISLITIAVVAPMGLTVQSLAAAYYARDQITASNLAQEGIESIRSVRDANILASAKGTPTDLFLNVLPTCAPPDGCFIDSIVPVPPITACSGTCPALRTNGQLYSYTSGWAQSNFIRTITATVVRSDTNGSAQEVRVTVTVSWQTQAYKKQQIQLSENMYRWVCNNSGGSSGTVDCST
jgi:prepilin-type N-terminal cleavage/methylation domain-containing protein